MKKFRKLLSLVVPMTLVLSIFSATSPKMVVSAAEANMNFDIVTQVQEYGQDVTHLIIDVGVPVKANSLDSDTFSVTAKNYFPTDNSLIYEGEREVTKVYVNTEKSIEGSTETGQYIVVELKSGYTVTGASAMSYSGVNYRLDLHYNITQNSDIQLANNATIVDAEFTQGEVIDLVIKDFNLTTYNGQIIREYTPDPTKALPLVLWNHGGGETYRSTNGVDNEGAQLFANEGSIAWIQDENPCYILAPQRGTGTGYSRDNVISYINQLIAEGKVDGSRIYVGGCSAGGGETYSYLREFAPVFAAAFPICPAGTMNAELANIAKDVPMWFFHSADDTTINVTSTRNAVAALGMVDAKEVLYTEFEFLPYREDGVNGFYPGHWSWIPVLNNYNSAVYQTSIFDWIFNQKLDTSFDIITQVEDYGQDVTHLIIDAGGTINASTIDIDTFKVATKNYFPTNNRLVYDGEREVTNVYVNDEKSIDGSTETGRYIIIELKYGYTITGASAISYSGVNYKLNMNYTVTQNKNFDFVDGNVANNLVYKQGAIQNLIIDDFDLVTYNNQMIRTYAPEATEALPLVLWNHGAGETYNSAGGANNEGSQIFANKGGVGWVQDQYPCYVVAPQRGNGTGYSRGNVISYINQLIAEGKVDGNRVYVAGCSMGGAETYSYMREFPSYFAAAMPICPASAVTVAQAEIMKDIPMWLVQSADDTTVRATQTRTSVQRLQEAGGKEVRYTEFENLPYAEHGIEDIYPGHWSWIPALNNFYSDTYDANIFDWLFAHKLTSVNTKVLETVVNKANGLKAQGALDKVITSVKTKFNNALTSAEGLLVVPSYTLTQTQVNNAIKSLQEAMTYLSYIAVDKTELADLITLIEPDATKGDLYVASTFTSFMAALNEAKVVMDNGDLLEGVDEATIVDAWTKLIDAWTNLRRIPSKAGLSTLISNATTLDTKLYTASTVSQFNIALSNALSILENPEVTQEEVNKSVDDLRLALDNLVLLEKENEVEKEGEKTTEETSDVSNTPVVTKNKGIPKATVPLGNGVTKTGDATDYTAYISLGLFASAGIMALINKKRRDERVSN